MFGWFRKAKPEVRHAPAAGGIAPAVAAEVPESAPVLTVLLRDVPGDLDGLITTSGVRQLGFSAGPDGRIWRGGTRLRADLRAEPHGGAGLDRRYADGLEELGQGSLALTPSAVALPGSSLDPWGPEGELRTMTLLACGLCYSGVAVGVVVHRPGEMLLDTRAWLARAGNPADPLQRPIGAWIDVRAADGLLGAYGCEAMGLPRVVVPDAGEAVQGDALERAHEAVLYAVKQMVEQNRTLRDGELLKVPVGVAVGNRSLAEGNPEMEQAVAVGYQVEDHGDRLVLTPLESAPTPAELWRDAAESGRPIAYLTYRHLLLDGFRRLGWQQVAQMAGEAAIDLPTHELIVYALPQGGFATTTCGIGRIRQPNGRAYEGTAHVELTLPLTGHHPAIAQTLSVMSRLFHGRGQEAPPVGSGMRVRFTHPVPPLGIEAAAFGALGVTQPVLGPPIALLTPVIMNAEESATIPDAEVGRWIEGAGSTHEVVDRWMQRVRG